MIYIYIYIHVIYSTLCITHVLSRHVLLIFGFHQNGSPEMFTPWKGWGNPSHQESITATQRTFAAQRNLKMEGAVGRVTVFESFNKAFNNCPGIFQWWCLFEHVAICCYLLLLSFKAESILQRPPMQAMAKSWDARNKAKTHWQKLADTVLQIDTQEYTYFNAICIVQILQNVCTMIKR